MDKTSLSSLIFAVVLACSAMAILVLSRGDFTDFDATGEAHGALMAFQAKMKSHQSEPTKDSMGQLIKASRHLGEVTASLDCYRNPENRKRRVPAYTDPCEAFKSSLDEAWVSMMDYAFKHELWDLFDAAYFDRGNSYYYAYDEYLMGYRGSHPEMIRERGDAYLEKKEFLLAYDDYTTAENKSALKSLSRQLGCGNLSVVLAMTPDRENPLYTPVTLDKAEILLQQRNFANGDAYPDLLDLCPELELLKKEA